MNKTFQNFGEYLYYAYANLQMLHYALKADKPKIWPHVLHDTSQGIQGI